MPLGPNQLAILASADPAELRSGFRGVARNWREQRWLARRNRYAINTISKLEHDVQHSVAIPRRQLNQYIGASAIVHCVDGWGYVSRSLEALLAGDIHAATHLAYYAELRAAMSTLASAGIGVFDKRNFVVVANGDCKLINGRTHTFAWQALEAWAGQPSAKAIVLSVIQPGGIPLAEWLQHFPASMGAALQSMVVGAWLQEWGLDLKEFERDRDARNLASYRPSDIPTALPRNFNDVLVYLENLWNAFEPTSPHPFRQLDRHLLRRSVIQAFQAATGTSPRRAKRQFRRFVSSVLHAVNPIDMPVGDWETFLAEATTSFVDLPILKAASARSPHRSSTHHIEVVSRAILLLRLATGSARDLIGLLAPSERVDLQFWWNAFGQERGFWDVGGAPADLVDLWSDVESAIAASQGWRSSGNARRSFYAAPSRSTRALSECERISMWSLGL